MHITIVSGSTRQGRDSHRIALALDQALQEKRVKTSIIDLNEIDLPLFEERVHKHSDPPAHLQKIAEQLAETDGFIFLTPEYNGGITSSLKNFIDTFAKAPFEGKPIGVAACSAGAMGGMRAAMQLQQTILAIFAYPQPQMLLVGRMTNVFDPHGTLLDLDFAPKFNGFIDSFVKFAKRFDDSIF